MRYTYSEMVETFREVTGWNDEEEYPALEAVRFYATAMGPRVRKYLETIADFEAEDTEIQFDPEKLYLVKALAQLIQSEHEHMDELPKGGLFDLFRLKGDEEDLDYHGIFIEAVADVLDAMWKKTQEQGNEKG